VSGTRGLEATTLVLLPGLDGTDVFLRPLLAVLPSSVRPLVVCFPAVGANDYTALLPIVQQAVARLPSFYVLGWSFSGPLAVKLAAAEPSRVRGIILAATFVRPPRPMLSRMKYLACAPVVWAVRAGRRVPDWLFAPATDPFKRDKAETWARVDAGTVAARVRTVLDLDVRDDLRRCTHPVLCLAGSRDVVVPCGNVDDIVKARPSAEMRTIEGRHFALYTNPRAAADVIMDFINRQEMARR